MKTLKTLSPEERKLLSVADVLLLPPHPTLDVIFSAALFFKAEEEGRRELGRDPLVISRTDKVSWRAELGRGRICLGFGDGPLDHTAYPQHTTCSQLTAKYLGMAKRPWVKELLAELEKLSRGDFVPGYFHLAEVVRVAVGEGEQLEVISNTITSALLPLLRSQQRFWEEALKEAKRAKWVEGSEKAKICIADGVELREFNRAARYLGAALVIQRQPSGNVQIFANGKVLGKRAAQVTGDLVQILRARELEIADKAVFLRSLTITQLRAEKFSPEYRQDLAKHDQREKAAALAEELAVGDRWFRRGPLVLNGSENRPSTPPTQIPLSDKEGIGILQAAEAALAQAAPAGNKCTPHNCGACRWHFAKLPRCFAVRRSARDESPRTSRERAPARARSKTTPR